MKNRRILVSGIVMVMIGIVGYMDVNQRRVEGDVGIRSSIRQEMLQDSIPFLLLILIGTIVVVSYFIIKAIVKKNNDVIQSNQRHGMLHNEQRNNGIMQNTQMNNKSEGKNICFCSSCGSKVLPSENFCSICGNNLKENFK